MCGIVGAVAKLPVADVLLDGLSALEYRGYDSAGLCVFNDALKECQMLHTLDKVDSLRRTLEDKRELGDLNYLGGTIGIAHTRWATHGGVCLKNAHPFKQGNFYMVHNGIIENYEEIRASLPNVTYTSETDSEVLLALINSLASSRDTIDALHAALDKVSGSYALALMHESEKCLYVARMGSPLVIGVTNKRAYYVASDIMALSHLTSRFIFLEDGDSAVISCNEIKIFDKDHKAVTREERVIDSGAIARSKGQYEHYMQKEIFEQGEVMMHTVSSVVHDDGVDLASFEKSKAQSDFSELIKNVEHIEIVACGTSYHAGLVGKYYLEAFSGISTNVTIASEYRYKRTIVPKNSLFITISQSGETADTLAALKLAGSQNYLASLVVCNVANSSLVRGSDYVFYTKAGAEIGVASTKAFTTQLLALMVLTIAMGQGNGQMDKAAIKEHCSALKRLPVLMDKVLNLEPRIKEVSSDFLDKNHSLFLGRGAMYPIALEGALKLKEISYIHAEGYAAGELKHGPLALIDSQMPVIVVAPDSELLPKVLSNIEEVRSRGGQLYVLGGNAFKDDPVTHVEMGEVPDFISPIIYTVPLQLLSYHVAKLRGNDIDQPRNLAKSVTVE